MKSTINFGYLIFLSVVAALGGFLFGYDTAVISGTIAQVTQLFQLDALQQGWYVGCALVGSIVGVLFAGILSDKLGRKLTMVISAVLFSTSALGCALSADFAQLVVYRIIGGVGIGVVSIVSPLYISELAVAQYRGRLVSLYQLAVTVGFLGAYLVNYQLLAWAESGTQLSVDWLNKIFITEVWRGMLGMETLPAILFFIIIFFIPESPRWLIVRGKELKAVNILEKIYNSITEAKSQLNETKSVLTSETKSEWSLLMKPGIFKAVIIGVCIAILGQFMGVNAVLYYGPSIFENAGLSGGDSLFYQVLVELGKMKVNCLHSCIMVEKFYLYRVKLTNTPIMRRIFYLLFLVLLGYSFDVKASDTVFIHETQIPVLIERQDNVLFYIRLDAKESKMLDEVVLDFSKSTNLADVQAIKLYYGGTEALQDQNKNRFAPVEYISSHRPGATLAANPSYSIKCAEVGPSEKVVLRGNYNLFPGVNFFWISLQMKTDASLHTKIVSDLHAVKVDGKELYCKFISPKDITHRMAVGVRHAGNDGSASFRIPGLVTTNKGTLLGVYDVRYNSSVDLQEYVDVGLSRSTDGGKSWEKMRLPLSLGEYGGLPKAQNGVGDPSILVDTQTNTVWVVAAWTHGMGNQRAWWSSHPGMDINHTAQLVLAKSTDDGKTWSKPINITEQVKDPSWYFLLQGPGRGITMSDGTLVFPTQFIDSTRIPNAGIMYSKDRGKTWKMHHLARTNTTEAQVAEIEPGVLMLNMRDNRGGSRAVALTKDLGKTWTEHPSSRKALQEPVCMASLIHVDAKDNILNKDLLLFSNPDTTKGRNHITIKASLDKGLTWLPEHQIMLDEAEGWGYSCLTMIDKETIGILYESSVAHMTFQAVKLTDLLGMK